MSSSRRNAGKTYKIVCVSWGDAFIDSADFNIKDAKNTTPIYRKTVGFLIVKNQYGYVLSTDIYDDNEEEASAKMFIPLGMVTSVVDLVPSP